MKLVHISYALILGMLIIACGTGSSGDYDETTTRGNIKIGVEDSYRPLLDTEIYTFEALYKYAKVTPYYGTETEVFSHLLKDSVRLIIASRELTEREREVFKQQKITPRITKIAYDAVALVVSKDNPDSVLTYTQARDIITGRTNTWTGLKNNKGTDTILIVFDNVSSANARYFKEKFSMDKFPANVFAAKTNEEVINYVEKNKNAIGVVSVNWISDKHDTVSHNFLQKIKVLHLGLEDTAADNRFYSPHQGYIAQKTYPFIRSVYIISREPFSGLGTGFASFVAGDKGQRIILKSGLVPSTMPVRIVEINNESF